MYACMYVCMHVCMYACMHVCMYACLSICMYVYIYKHVCMHVYIYITRSDLPFELLSFLTRLNSLEDLLVASSLGLKLLVYAALSY